MLKYSKPVIIREEEKPVATKEIKTSADIGGAEPVVLQQQQLPPKKDPVLLTQSGMGGGTIFIILFVVYCAIKLVFNKIRYGKVFLMPQSADGGRNAVFAFFFNTWVTLFAFFKNPCMSYNIFCAPDEAWKEELFQGITKVASSVADPEVSSILTSLSQL